MRLYTAHRNSAGERVRIALNLKGLAYDYVSIPGMAPGEYAKLNPQGLMPALEVDGRVIAQSGAILQYLEESFPDPPLLPAEPVTRAQARAFAAHIAAEMHAITISRVRKALGRLGVDEAGIQGWVDHWLSTGFAALEAELARRRTATPFCFSDTPGWADLHLVPQMAAARRLGCDLTPYPRLLAVEANCGELDAFVRARPERQPDYR